MPLTLISGQTVIPKQANSQQAQIPQTTPSKEYESSISGTSGNWNTQKASYIPVEVKQEGDKTIVYYRDVYHSMSRQGKNIFVDEYSAYDKKIETYQNGQLVRVQEYEPYSKSIGNRYTEKAVQLVKDIDYSQNLQTSYDTPRTVDKQTGILTSEKDEKGNWIIKPYKDNQGDIKKIQPVIEPSIKVMNTAYENISARINQQNNPQTFRERTIALVWGKQGYQNVRIENGQVIGEKEGKTYTSGMGELLVETGKKTGTFYPENVSAMEKQRLDYAEKKRIEKIQQQAIEEKRPAALASRIVLTKEASPSVEKLFTQRKAELLSQAGEEARLAHYPQYLIPKGVVGRQEYGTPIAKLKKYFENIKLTTPNTTSNINASVSYLDYDKAVRQKYSDYLVKNKIEFEFMPPKEAAKYYYNPNKQVVAFYEGDKNLIRGNINYLKYFPTMFPHEIGHAMDVNNNQQYNLFLNTDAWKKRESDFNRLKLNPPISLSKESFAVNASEFFINPTEYSKKYPEQAKILLSNLSSSNLSKTSEKETYTPNKLDIFNNKQSINELPNIKEKLKQDQEKFNNFFAKVQEKFYPPKAIISYNKKGEPVLGLPKETATFQDVLNLGASKVEETNIAIQKKELWAPIKWVSSGATELTSDILKHPGESILTIYGFKQIFPKVISWFTGKGLSQKAASRVVGTALTGTFIGSEVISNPTSFLTGEGEIKTATKLGIFMIPEYTARGFRLFKEPIIKGQAGEKIITENLPEGQRSQTVATYEITVGKKTYNVVGTGKEIAYNLEKDNLQKTISSFELFSGKTKTYGTSSGLRYLEGDNLIEVSKYRLLTPEGKDLTGVRVSPEKYAQYLSNKRKLIYESAASKESFLNPNTKGLFTYPTKLQLLDGIPNIPTIKISWNISPTEKQPTIAHELIHFKTPKWLLEIPSLIPESIATKIWGRKGEYISYRSEPSEIISHNLEKLYAKIGFPIKKVMPERVKYSYGTTQSKTVPLITSEKGNVYLTFGISQTNKAKDISMKNFLKFFTQKNLMKQVNKELPIRKAITKGKATSIEAGIIKEKGKLGELTLAEAKLQELMGKKQVNKFINKYNEFFKRNVKLETKQKIGTINKLKQLEKLETFKKLQENRSQTLKQMQKQILEGTQKKNLITELRLGAKQTAKSRFLTESKKPIVTVLSIQTVKQKNILKEKQLPKKVLKSETRQSTYLSSETKQSLFLNIRNALTSKSNLKEILMPSLRQTSTSKTEQTLRQQQRQKEILKQKQEQALITKSKGREIILTPQRITTDILLSPFGSKQSQLSSNQGYDAYIKRTQLKKGKGNYQSRGYVKVNNKPLYENTARNLVGNTLDTYANRSGFIKKSNRKATGTNEPVNNFLMQKFRSAKNNKNVMVEKSKYAIDSPQEKEAIPYEAQRQKAKRNNQFNPLSILWG